MSGSQRSFRSASDWATLEAGIIQRARLAEASIADVYTDARIVSAGLVRSGAVFLITRTLVDSTRALGSHIALMGAKG